MFDAQGLQDRILEGNTVRLMPMRREHGGKLLEAASDGDLWELWFTSIPDAENIDSYMDLALTEKGDGLGLPFVVYHKPSESIIGTTRFCHADGVNRRVEIGYTWYAQSFQRTSVNTECKLLLLTLAFEELSAIAVELRTHWHNHNSRNAIARLGAKQDGVLRNHRKDTDGSFRDTVVFSIIQGEWPAVKKSLNHKLARNAG